MNTYYSYIPTRCFKRCVSVCLLALLLASLAGRSRQIAVTVRATNTYSAAPGSAPASANGKIAFTSGGILVMNSDSSNQTSITSGGWTFAREPAWSPDGSKILFTLNNEIYVMNANGSNQIHLTDDQGFDSSPTWSPDGTKVAFSRRHSIDFNVAQIYVMNANGSNQTRLTNYQTCPQDCVAPAWSPDGSKIAFATLERLVDGGVSVPNDICVMNANGVNQIRLTASEHHDGTPTWSPDGARIGFTRQPSFVPLDEMDVGNGNEVEIYVMNANGSNQVQLTNNSAEDFDPAWSPDGSKLAFASTRDGNPNRSPEIYVMNADGSSQIRLTHNPDAYSFGPTWQSLPRPTGNPIDDSAFFVRQHYFDFLNRVPDPAGYAGWQAELNNCASGDTSCDRIHVSSAFFRSPEFQARGYFLYRFYPVSFGRKPDYSEFIYDLTTVGGFFSDAQLESAKQVFITEFMNRPAFVMKFNGLDNTQYVDTLLSTSGITHLSRDSWIAALTNGSRTRAQVLREIAESPDVYNKYYNQAFVVMQYFGYLRRQPDALYLNWIAHLDATGDYRSMIHGFINSIEYRARFGP